ncbi:hypothetical protein H2198_009845 [Neophaeococcomyces mojaviensis]|uniref:Uncharacterized protein n=1 Tax=Neophaeococcomyces mojaviensis TaxID=3383035 RepID=A0ACC2ZTM6_9EURO|nr:hypothetical protein H2198_009845 [Knufia sp. JES_112]
MPGVGKIISAHVAASFRASFLNIRLGLVVGICGAVPQLTAQDEEIFLGDMIISTGIIQLDFGRQLPDQVIRKDTLKDNLGRPNQEVRAFLSKLQGWQGRLILRQRISTWIAAIFNTDGFSSWCYPGIDEDILYQADYYHEHCNEAVCIICAQNTKPDSLVCDTISNATYANLKCDEDHLVTRERSESIVSRSASSDNAASSMVPRLHFGLIASSDIKSAQHRDQIAAKEQVIGFEMEGAGVWDNFPTIVIKGVCDYADSHINKKWQKYAAVAAAVCTNGILENWRETDEISNPFEDPNKAGVLPRYRDNRYQEVQHDPVSVL